MNGVDDSRVLLERVATQMSMHIQNDDKVFAEIAHTQKNIQQSINHLIEKLDRATQQIAEKTERGIQRVHERIDDQAKATVEAIEAVRTEALAAAGTAKAHAQAAHDKIQEEKTSLLVKVISLLLSGGGIGAFIGYKAKGG